jgi:membrane protease YdiL (CAAX protease family)
MQTLMRPEAVIDRITYTLVANIIIGIILALVVIRCAIKRKTISLTSAGFQPLKRTIIAVVVACILGIMVLFIQHPPSLDPVILLNVYAQVFTVTIAEIAVCWAVMGSIVEGALSKKGRVAAIISGIIFASVLFGVYHFAHSPPFNQPTMVLFLSAIGVVTSLVYFIGRDIYATMVFHNFFGSIWVMQSLSASGLLDTYSQPLYPVMGMAVISLAIFVIVDLFYVRKKPVTI